MNARDRRRVNETAGILMTTKGLDSTQAVLEAAVQLGMVQDVVPRQDCRPSSGQSMEVAKMATRQEPAGAVETVGDYQSFGTFSKVDNELQQVEGYASTIDEDSQGDIVTLHIYAPPGSPVYGPTPPAAGRSSTTCLC